MQTCYTGLTFELTWRTSSGVTRVTHTHWRTVIIWGLTRSPCSGIFFNSVSCFQL